MVELSAHPLDLRQQTLVHHEQTTLRVIEHSSERFAAQPRVDAEQCEPGVAAACVEHQELRVILQQHRDMTGLCRAASSESLAQKTRPAHRLIAIEPQPAIASKISVSCAGSRPGSCTSWPARVNERLAGVNLKTGLRPDLDHRSI